MLGFLAAWSRTRPPARAGFEIGRIVAGVGFLVAAAFNLLVTRHKPDGGLSALQEAAWLPQWEHLMRVAASHGRGVTTTAAIYELALAGCVLSRGPLVHVGLLGGIGWAFVTTPLNPPIPAIGNFALAPAFALLMARSYPASSLDPAARRNRT